MRHHRAIAITMITLWAACGGTVAVEDDGGGGSGGAGGSVVSSSSGMIGPGSIQSVRAPTQFTVEVKYDGTPPDGALTSLSFDITSPKGDLEVLEAVTDEAAQTVTLTTAKQKLGVSYSLSSNQTNDGDFPFIAADTALFWTVDLSSPNFEEVQLVCDREAVSEHAVVYIAQGQSAFNIPAATNYFDSQIYPIETAMFQQAPDQDDNGLIVLLGVDGKGAFGGYFNPLDTMTDEEAQQFGYHSNETEVLYLNVESGAIDAEHVVTHEFMHLLYHEHPAHDSIFNDWSWHNEGMAECGVRAVTGGNEYAPFFYVEDPFGDIADGLSMVDWQGGNYSQYALSYLFLSYVAGQIGGVMAYPQLFDLPGSPESIEALTMAQLSQSFAQAHLTSLVAAQVQASSGLFSYNGMVAFPGQPPLGSAPLTLAPFSGAFVQPSSSPVFYPGTQGPNIVYAGINGQGQVDFSEPFDTAGGRLLVFNVSTDVDNLSPEPSGNLLPSKLPSVSDAAKEEARQRARRYVRQHPPPFNPTRIEIMRAWQRSAGLR